MIFILASSMPRGPASLASAAFLIALAACGQPAPGGDHSRAGPASADARLTASRAWARTPPGGRDITAAYVAITAGSAGDRLITATSAEADRIELHVTTMESGVMRMRPAEDGVEIEPGESLVMEPGGVHFMVFGLAETAADDGALELTLEFESGAALDVSADFSLSEPG